MSLERGARIGHYEVLELIGEGGMGQVYRALDTQLGRDVALKFLPVHFNSDADRMERFAREAHVLASLNHANIASIYGVQESKPMRALVMELVEGPTLADRLARGPMPLEEILSVAKQIAEGLEYAHERGIIHRDLKPANIKLTPDDRVKILDFGLAKAVNEEVRTPILSDSPTLSLAATQAGVILGTAAYMSPEQAKGKSVDRRADIWSFGVVLFEMLTGRMMFSGETVSETMAQVMMKEPDWSALPAETPVRLRELVRRCLVKDPRRRMRDIGDVRIALEEILNPSEQAQPQPAPSASRSTILPWLVAALAAAVAIAALWTSLTSTRREAPAAMRLTSDVGADAVLATGTGAAAFLSPDGHTLAFVASKELGQTPQLYVRRLDQLQATPVAGTAGARNAFFSPDGQWIAFFAEGKLKKVSVAGGAVVTLCDAEDDRGGTWVDGATIVFTPTTRSGLLRVSSAGGKPEPITKLNSNAGEITHRWPYAAPGTRTVFFIGSSTSNNYEDADILAYSLATGETKLVYRGGYYPHYLPSGYVLYMHDGTLFAAAFDPEKLQLKGQPAPALEGVMSSPNNGASQYAVSETGALTYIARGNTVAGASIKWLTHDGRTSPLRAALGRYVSLRFSPDGRRLAFERIDEQYDIWVYEWQHDALTRLTFDPTQDAGPVWTPDGRRIAFASQRADKATFNLYWVPSDGAGEPQRLTESKQRQLPTSFHPSGKFLAFDEITQTATDIMILPMEGSEASGWKPGKAAPFLATRYSEGEASFSPNGRWLAYWSDESGRDQVYVRPFPGPGGKWQISTTGGRNPTWSLNRNELYYERPDQKIMVATYTAEGDSFRADTPQVWSETVLASGGLGERTFDIHPDGQRFGVLQNPDAQGQLKLNKINFLFNFSDELARIGSAH